jgi:hypothetical protein
MFLPLDGGPTFRFAISSLRDGGTMKCRALLISGERRGEQ